MVWKVVIRQCWRDHYDVGACKRCSRDLGAEFLCQIFENGNVFMRAEHLDHDLGLHVIGLEDVSAKILYEFDDKVVFEDAALIHDRFKHYKSPFS